MLDPRLAYQVTSILSDDAARAPTYGRNSVLVLPNRPAAVKTGTTDEFRDSWVVGYLAGSGTGVWVGNTNNSPMRDILGAAGAGQIWHTFMVAALGRHAAKPFAQPQGVVQAEVCALSGMLPTPECRENGLPVHGVTKDIFVQGVNLPTKADDWHQRVEVCKVNGKRATPLVPQNARESKSSPRARAVSCLGGGTRVANPPTEDCSDIYQGERVASILGPAGATG